VVLLGPPKRAMRASIAPAFVARLVAELARRYRYVILDIGTELAGSEPAAANHRAALGSAQQVVLVGGADLVGLWHARTALDQLERQLGVERERIGLVINRHDPRHHHSRSEIAWHLGAPVITVVPFDQTAVQRATAAQYPLVEGPTGRAARALIELAERIYDGKLRPVAGPQRRNPVLPWWRHMGLGRRRAARHKVHLEPQSAALGAIRDARDSVSL
jgi:Flp pilus assembly CpaE family ATPase